MNRNKFIVIDFSIYTKQLDSLLIRKTNCSGGLWTCFFNIYQSFHSLFTFMFSLQWSDCNCMCLQAEAIYMLQCELSSAVSRTNDTSHVWGVSIVYLKNDHNFLTDDFLDIRIWSVVWIWIWHFFLLFNDSVDQNIWSSLIWPINICVEKSDHC